MKNVSQYALIVAGGKGLRMNADVPKQFLCVYGKPVLMHSIAAFYAYNSSITIIVVLPNAHMHTWEKLCEKYNFRIPHRLIDGGEERFFSVKNGLSCVPADSLVAIHDGVRPCITKHLLERGFTLAAKYGGVIPVVDSVDSLREIDGKSHTIIDRTKIKRVQTPQFFQSQKLKKSYEQDFSDTFTDDASVYEQAEFDVHVFTGDQYNIKITHSCDIAIVEAILQYQQTQ
ncbi:MAG: 2-C-methyl-D-erythritol 4-phosphate cytidylyltransferase [Bacteroidales bacterium]|jgi:2-C-methyl-D-erythritol 4-phosphate cytidylyltransferase|nr:2-C-methyl-D-erythritol 4-phosphate cytidylyltransferase [Bacteroidales bacterium]